MVGNGMCKGTEAGQGMQHSHSACGLGRAGQVGPVPVLNSSGAEGPFFKPPGSHPAEAGRSEVEGLTHIGQQVADPSKQGASCCRCYGFKWGREVGEPLSLTPVCQACEVCTVCVYIGGGIRGPGPLPICIHSPRPPALWASLTPLPRDKSMPWAPLGRGQPHMCGRWWGCQGQGYAPITDAQAPGLRPGKTEVSERQVMRGGEPTQGALSAPPATGPGAQSLYRHPRPQSSGCDSRHPLELTPETFIEHLQSE